MSKVMMACGCAAQGTSNGKPVCATHLGLTEMAEKIVETPDLTGRKAQCPYCHTKVDSSVDLAFFVHSPGVTMDSYYCGCRGWD